MTIEEQIQAIWPKTDLQDYEGFWAQTQHDYGHDYSYEEDCEWAQKSRATTQLVREYLSEALVSPNPLVRDMADFVIRLDKLLRK